MATRGPRSKGDEPFVPLPATARRGVEREAGRLADYLDKDLRLTWFDPV